MKSNKKHCPKCGTEITDAKAKTCTECGSKLNTPIFKKWWFWVVIAAIVIALATGGGNSSDSTDTTNDTTNSTTNDSGAGVSLEYKNALKQAKSYSDTLHMSKQAIYDQLVSEYGEKFPADAAQYAIDNLNADYKTNALKKAKSYSDTMYMSKQGIYDQLISQYGEKFTEEEAQYAIDNLNADYKANALKKAKYAGDFTFEALKSFNRIPDELMEDALIFLAKSGRYLMKKIME